MRIPRKVTVDKFDNKKSRYVKEFNSYEIVVFHDEYLRNSGKSLVEEPTDEDHLIWEEHKYDWDFAIFRSQILVISCYWARESELYRVALTVGSVDYNFDFKTRQEAKDFQNILLEWKLNGEKCIITLDEESAIHSK